ncbi:hypothetical protein ASZ78_005981 [Callipepla squamata]|uniref:Uncharacterized protein n=1 Tax=Callipepla squamata TaxID=9009 RepID=A0A226MSS7_CALSU|nr:hypothetical protein ASZ78_005981 [Callipepla squamata]
MAAASGAAVRLRLHFDFPPPGSPGCSLCWLLLEPGQARLVTDLLSIIRHRFGFSRRARLSLFLDGALLPPTESARLVRDNDALRVTLEEILAEDCEEADGHLHAAEDGKKRHKRRRKERGFSGSGEERRERERKKSKRNPVCSSGGEGGDGDASDTGKKSKKRKRREENSGKNRVPEGKESSAAPKLQNAEMEERTVSTAKDGRRAAGSAAKPARGHQRGSPALKAAKSTSKHLAAEARDNGKGTSTSTSSDSDSSEVNNAVDVPKRDYSVLPLLAAPPQVGQRIAFKRLELNENYSPEVSSYKEGRIISWNADKKQIELEILSSSASQVAKEPGKFDLVYQSADGAELIEYAVPQDTKITESWESLIEPRLIVEPPLNGSGTENGTV